MGILPGRCGLLASPGCGIVCIAKRSCSKASLDFCHICRCPQVNLATLHMQRKVNQEVDLRITGIFCPDVGYRHHHIVITSLCDLPFIC